MALPQRARCSQGWEDDLAGPQMALIPVRLEILPNAVVDLRRLGWLDDANQCNGSTIANVVVGLVERALALRLRPFD
jgi:hypothetical protein